MSFGKITVPALLAALALKAPARGDGHHASDNDLEIGS